MAGECCLAYLNFPDFETRVTPYRENANTDMVALNKFVGQGQPLIASDNPRRDVIRVWNAVRKPKPSTLQIDITRHIPLPKAKAQSLARFPFLPYVASNWLWHTIDFASGEMSDGDNANRKEQKARRGTLFRDLILPKQLLFEFRPWGTFDETNQRLSSIALLGWAFMANHTYLIKTASIGDELLRPSVLIPEACRWFAGNAPTYLEEISETRLDKLSIFSEDSYTLESPELGWLYSRILCAARKGHLNVMQECQLAGLQDYSIVEHLIVEASAAGHVPIIDWFHHNARRIYTNFTVAHESRYLSAMEIALLAGHNPAVVALSKFGYKASTLLPNKAAFYTMMNTAILEENLNVIESLLFLRRENYSSALGAIHLDGPGISDAFLNAVRLGNQRTIEILLKNGVGPNIQDELGLTALVVAITASQLSLVETLLRYGCNMDNTRHGLPLTIAVCLGDLEIASLLIEYGAEIFKDDFNHVNATALVSLMQLLTAEDPQPAARIGLSPTPLYMASYCGHREIAEILINHGAAVNFASPSGLWSYTDQNANEDIGELKYDIDLSFQTLGRSTGLDIRSWDNKGLSRWEYPITAAVVEGHPDIVDLLIIAGSKTSPLLPSLLENQSNALHPHSQSPRVARWDVTKIRNDIGHGQKSRIEEAIFTNLLRSQMNLSVRQCEIFIAAGANLEIGLKQGQEQEMSLFLWAIENRHYRLAEKVLRGSLNRAAVLHKAFTEATEKGGILLIHRLHFEGISIMYDDDDGAQLPDPTLIKFAKAGNSSLQTGFIEACVQAALRTFQSTDNFSVEERRHNLKSFQQLVSSIIDKSWHCLLTCDQCCEIV
jgi:ankyrin repeat protein